jgi:hypothetical protein
MPTFRKSRKVGQSVFVVAQTWASPHSPLDGEMGNVPSEDAYSNACFDVGGC